MLTVSPSIAPEIYRIAPGFRALSICVEAAPVLNPALEKRRYEAPVRRFWPVSLNGRNLIWPHGPTFFKNSVRNLNAPLAQLMRYVDAYCVTERCLR